MLGVGVEVEGALTTIFLRKLNICTSVRFASIIILFAVISYFILVFVVVLPLVIVSFILILFVDLVIILVELSTYYS